GKMNNDPSWTPGVSGTVAQNGAYIEDTGKGSEGHLIVVNDTRVTIDDAYSFHPSIGVDMEGNTHIAWMDGRDYGFEKDVNYEIYYTKLRLQGAGEFDGRDDGLSTYAIKKINDTPISNVETYAGLPQNAPWGGNSVFPSLLTDDQNQVHIAWVDSGNISAGEELLYVRLNHTSLEGDGLTALDPWETVAITSWSSNKLGPNSGYKPSIGMPPAFSNDLGSGAHVAWSDTNKCNDETNNNRFTVCYSHVLTGQVDVDFDDGETFYHVIEPGEQTIYNLTMNNSTPGPKDLVADSYGLNITGVPTNWTATLFFADNHTAIFPDTEIFLEGGESIRFYLRVRAPSIYQANADELAEIRVDAKSYKDPAIRSEITTLTLMDVVHGIDLDASHSVADVEQGQTAIFSITITNTGNVADTFLFWDPQTLEGRQEWLLPFAWDVNFPLSVQLDPQQTVTKNLEISVPTSEDPGAFVILLKGWSAGEPVKSVEKGTYDILELGVFVSIRSSNNIVFNITDQEAMVTPAPYAPNALDPNCHVFEIEVEKYFDTGDLVFTTPGTTGNDANWTTEVIFPNGLNLNPDGVSYPWVLMSGDDYRMHVVKVKICAPDDAPAGLGKAVTIKAHLKGYPKISAAKILQVDVDHVYRLSTDVSLVDNEQLTVNPGDSIILPTTVNNNGNGPDRFDYTLARVTDSAGVDVIWDITVPRNTLEELDSGSSQSFEVLMNIPQQVPAGDYTVVFHTKSEQKDEDAAGRMTRLRDVTTLTVTVREFYDMQISMDPTVENDVKTSAPGRVVRFIVNVTNAGNVPDVPTLDNHTSVRSGTDITVNEQPDMGTLDGWDVSWRIIRQVGLDLESEEDCVSTTSTAASFPEDSCVYLEDIDSWRLPEMAPYETYTMVAIVSIDPGAQLTTRSLGLKVVSMMGNAEQGGDHDDSPSWVGDLLDSNEKIVTINLRAPNLVVKSATTDSTSADVGESIPIRIEIANTGNVHASDIEVILCEYNDEDMISEIRKNDNMCDEESILMRQIIAPMEKPDDSQDERVIELYMLYPVTAGSKNVYVIVDPGNTIVEANEGDNIVRISQELGSSNPFLDVAGEVVGKVALPTMIVLLTFSLFGVLYLVGRGRRAAVKDRIAEQSSLMSVLGDEADN
ncbi:MAG: CARDB domain-containing protein, partial [Candidatus Poseidoniaceae archaeon]